MSFLIGWAIAAVFCGFGFWLGTHFAAQRPARIRIVSYDGVFELPLPPRSGVEIEVAVDGHVRFGPSDSVN